MLYLCHRKSKNVYLIEYQNRMEELRIYGNDLAKVQVH